MRATITDVFLLTYVSSPLISMGGGKYIFSEQTVKIYSLEKLINDRKREIHQGYRGNGGRSEGSVHIGNDVLAFYKLANALLHIPSLVCAFVTRKSQSGVVIPWLAKISRFSSCTEM